MAWRPFRPGAITEDLLPKTTEEVNIGSTTKKWLTAFIATITIATFVLTGRMTTGGFVNMSDVMFVDNVTGNVGIGTINPTEKLDIDGNINLSGVIKNADGTAAAPSYTFWGDTNTGLRRASADNISLVTGGSDRVTINSSGNVGIGTTSPTQGKLVINGDTAITDISPGGTPAISFYSGGAGGFENARIESTNSEPSYNDAGHLMFYTARTSQQGLTEKMRIEDNGNVGIGTAAPTYPLTVAKNVSNISLWVESAVSAQGYLYRTTKYDKTRGKALDFIKDSDYYLSKGEINHTKFYGYAGEYEDAVSITMELDVLRQAVYELKTELCIYNSYSWC